jgi:hypothetical protein
VKRLFNALLALPTSTDDAVGFGIARKLVNRGGINFDASFRQKITDASAYKRKTALPTTRTQNHIWRKSMMLERIAMHHEPPKTNRFPTSDHPQIDASDPLKGMPLFRPSNRADEAGSNALHKRSSASITCAYRPSFAEHGDHSGQPLMDRDRVSSPMLP